MKIWYFYGAGAFLTLLWKLVRYAYHGRNMGRPYKDILCEWFFESSSENAVSWITTIAIVWAFGFLYVGRYEIVEINFLAKIPLASPIAFLLGSLMELAAPAAAKWVLGKLPGGAA